MADRADRLVRFFQIVPLLALLAVAFVALGGVVRPVPAAAQSFQACLKGLWPAARRAGVSAGTFNQVTSGMTPDPDTVRLMGKQSEFVKPIWDYLDSAVSSSRITTGRQMRQKYATQLAEIERRYGVDSQVVLAIWGVETSYGGFMGQHNALRALATLACEAPDRRDYWRDEFVTALQIVQAGHIAPNRMESSWAGAMGHTQFMPSSWKKHSADYDRDGKNDIWTDVPDALASTANYLKNFGWEAGKTWGYEVDLPANFDYSLADEETWRTLGQWRRLGITRTRGREFPRPSDKAFLLLPAGANGPAFLMLKNFEVIKRYNNATSYALAVGHLSDRIIGGGPFEKSWPRNDPPLSRDQVRQMQTLLTRKGFDTGGVDGRVGPMTRSAIRNYQKRTGQIADGYASVRLLQQLQ
ncbi:lytic murein transglycosylase [Amorphus sp. 3PC139-8]|uniref:lytic murein transglycosylase n=1 Tax=Amorphus sp. 3PC139-8 TaxID=2735676 RepID=UPI00345CDA8D